MQSDDSFFIETYTVKKGDTLYQIGVDHGLNWRFLSVLNQLKNPNLIQINQKIKVPNQTLWTVISEVYDIATIFVPWGFGWQLLLDTIMFFAQGNELKSSDIKQFLIGQGLNANVEMKVYSMYKILGNSKNKWVKLYSYIQGFVNYGVDKLIDKSKQ